jgi:LysM repeat protein
MHLPSLSLATLGFLLLSTGRFVNAASNINDLAVVHGVPDVELSAAYLSGFDSEDDAEADFELSDELDEESHTLTKRAEDCAKYHTVSGSDNCVKLAKEYGITLNDIYDWNPQIKSGCTNLNNGKKYCVKKGSSSSSSTGGCSKTHKGKI